MDQTANSGPIGFDDVVQALGDTDPASTNASKLRSIIGRGSYATIQRHLDAIREQRRKAEQPQEVALVPPAPPELLAMWGAAVAVAVAQVRTRLDGVVQERDALVPALQTSRSDVQALTAELEATGGRADGLETSMDSMIEAQEATATGHEKKISDLVEQHAKKLQEQEAQHCHVLAALQSDLDVSKNLAKVQELEATIASQTLQSTIDRLTDQVGDLKSMLHDRHVQLPAPAQAVEQKKGQ